MKVFQLPWLAWILDSSFSRVCINGITFVFSLSLYQVIYGLFIFFIGTVQAILLGINFMSYRRKLEPGVAVALLIVQLLLCDMTHDYISTVTFEWMLVPSFVILGGASVCLFISGCVFGTISLVLYTVKLSISTCYSIATYFSFTNEP